MRSCLCGILVVLSLANIILGDNNNVFYTTEYIDVPIDHFSFTSNATYKMKYLINDTYWIKGGPIFFYTGNEGTIESFAENTGFMFDIAPQFNALIVFAEHRYYGTSLPFGNKSFDSPRELGYLTTNQALADYVFLIKDLEASHPSPDTKGKVPVIAFGGSYGGMLASWIRMKYPASVYGSIAASAPIWQFQNITPCGNFYKIITDVYGSSVRDIRCDDLIGKSWKALRDVAKTPEGKSWISQEWKLCDPLTKDQQTEALVNWLDGIVTNIAMVNYPYPTGFLAPLPANPVRAFCEAVASNFNASANTNQALLSAIGKGIEVYTNYTQTTKCVNINNTASNLGENAWNFQACTEMIMPICSTDEDMFENAPWDFEKYADQCAKDWGVKQPRDDLPILEYGGTDISSASNIIFSNGLLDPWSAGGVLRNVSSTVYSVIIPDAAHHLDLRGKNDADPPSVVQARNFYVMIIWKWLHEFHLEFPGGLHLKKRPYQKVVMV